MYSNPEIATRFRLTTDPDGNTVARFIGPMGSVVGSFHFAPGGDADAREWFAFRVAGLIDRCNGLFQRADKGDVRDAAIMHLAQSVIPEKTDMLPGIEYMEDMGGSFARCIAQAAVRADRENWCALYVAFSHLFDRYQKIAERQ